MRGGGGTVPVLHALHATALHVAQQERAAIVAAVRSAQRAGAGGRPAAVGGCAIAAAAVQSVVARVGIRVTSAILSGLSKARPLGTTREKQREDGEEAEQRSERKLEHGAAHGNGRAGLRIRAPRRARFPARSSKFGDSGGAGVARAWLDHESVTWMTNDPPAEGWPPRFDSDRLQRRGR